MAWRPKQTARKSTGGPSITPREMMAIQEARRQAEEEEAAERRARQVAYREAKAAELRDSKPPTTRSRAAKDGQPPANKDDVKPKARKKPSRESDSDSDW